MNPLYALTSGKKIITWTDKHEEIRQKVISVPTYAPVLMIFDPNYSIDLQSDASSDGYAAILMHKVEGKKQSRRTLQ